MKNVGEVSLGRMSRISQGSRLFVAVGLVFALTFPASAAISDNGSTGEAEDVVTQRAKARWQALIIRDVNQAYTYLSPGYRLATPLRQYRGQIGGKVRWKDVAIKSVQCAQRFCDVNLNITYGINVATRGVPEQQVTTLLKEKWVLVDGQWWYLPKK